MGYIDKLTETRVLWGLFLAALVCTLAFQVIAGQHGLILLDAITDPEQSREAIALMSESQRSLHAWVTGTLDVLYPAVYGALFIGSAHNFFPKIGYWLALPSFLLVGVDLMEGAVQILGLTSVVDWLDAKAVLTPTKLLLFYFGLLVTICGWVAWLVRHFNRPAENQ